MPLRFGLSQEHLMYLSTLEGKFGVLFDLQCDFQVNEYAYQSRCNEFCGSYCCYSIVSPTMLQNQSIQMKFEHQVFLTRTEAERQTLCPCLRINALWVLS